MTQNTKQSYATHICLIIELTFQFSHNSPKDFAQWAILQILTLFFLIFKLTIIYIVIDEYRERCNEQESEQCNKMREILEELPFDQDNVDVFNQNFTEEDNANAADERVVSWHF